MQSLNLSFDLNDIHQSIGVRFLKVVKCFPEKIAIETESASLSYQSLANHALKFAHCIRQRDVKVKSRIIIGLRRPEDIVAAILGALLVGCIYVPIEIDFPTDRIRFIVEDADPSLIFVERKDYDRLSGLLSDHLRQCVILLNEVEIISPLAEEEIHGESLTPASILYTSGSTGAPKGVLQIHRNILYHIYTITQLFSVTANDKQSVLSSFIFDGSTSDLYCALLTGATLVPLNIRNLGAAVLIDKIAQHGITLYHSTPTTYREFMSRLKQEQQITSIRLVILGGETVTSRDYALFQQHCQKQALFVNGYGATETSGFATLHILKNQMETFEANTVLPIGKPPAGIETILMNSNGEKTDDEGELYIRSKYIAVQYWNAPDYSAQRFQIDSHDFDYRIYRTGDLAKKTADGSIQLLGRCDRQVKIRGYRVDLGEIEALAVNIAGVAHAVVKTYHDNRTDSQELALFVSSHDYAKLTPTSIRAQLSTKLPQYVLPVHIECVAQFPLTDTGKIDVKSLCVNQALSTNSRCVSNQSADLLEQLSAIWCQVLGVEQVSTHDNFFDLGGNSLLMARVHTALKERLSVDVALFRLFEYPTLKQLTNFLKQDSLSEDKSQSLERRSYFLQDDRIAIIGMGARFPGANNIEEYWNNLRAGIDSITIIRDEELLSAGVDPQLLQDPHFIKAAGKLEGIENFDASFFGYPPAQASIIDPQQRLFLEVAWTALEDAGYAADRSKIPIGVFAGSAPNKYFLYHLFGRELDPLAGHNWEIDDFPVGMNPDALTARVSYKFGLTGPSVSIQTACSSSLVSVAIACDSLLNLNCDLALAGGVAVQLPSQLGYLHQEGGMLSKSARCRPFDASADGSVFGSGVGVVVLKRLQNAIADKDQIYAVIRGWAVQNDGANRAGYTAPGVEGQANVVSQAHIAADVKPEQVSYVETHGSATPVGDPIEIAALTRAFNRIGANLRGSCAIGSVKSNLGHLDAAAGIAGLIKTALSLKHKILPKSLNFKQANPAIDFEHSPFHVQTTTADPWVSGTPLIAGVSSFGLGGTNAHVVLEEPPVPEFLSARNNTAILPISAKTLEACKVLTDNICKKLEANNSSEFIEDAAYSLALGRDSFTHRSVVIAAAKTAKIKKIFGQASSVHNEVVFLFPGVGDQFPNSFRFLYDKPGVFKEQLDYITELFNKQLHIDLLDFLYPKKQSNISYTEAAEPGIDLLKLLGRKQDENDVKMQSTLMAQPACFAIEYSLAHQLMAWGIMPSALIGHSIGEYVAATLAGVMSLEDAVSLVAARAKAISRMPVGKMLAVPLSAEELEPFLEKVSVSAINSPKLTVISGKPQAIEKCRQSLENHNILCQKLRTMHPFHSSLLTPAASDLVEKAKQIKFCAPKIPYISNVTGKWITQEQATSPEYWGKHLCECVQFSTGIRTLCATDRLGLYVEVGPGQTLVNYVRLIVDDIRPELKTIHTGQSYYEMNDGLAVMMEALAKIWVAGGPVDWTAFYRGNKRRRVSLPTYPFDSKRCWVEREATKFRAQKVVQIQKTGQIPTPLQAAISTTLSEESISSRPDLGVPYVPPRNAIEEKLVKIWQGLFGYSKIGVDDDFVSLGGHSLLALQFANKLWRLHKVEVALAVLLDHSTIAQLAKHLESAFEKTPGTFSEVSFSENLKNEGARVTIIENYLISYFTSALGYSVSLESPLKRDDIVSSLPQLIYVLHRDFEFRMYPNEIIGFQSVRDIAFYITEELLKHQPNQSNIVCESVQKEKKLQDTRPIAFILSAVRSGSTLLRVMLAGHPQLFCPPEFHLLAYSSMKERAAKDVSPDQNQGIETALMEAFHIDRIEAAKRIEEMIEQDLATEELVSQIAEAVAPRLLIDKSPGNANNVTTLKQIKTVFPNAKFICLFRHPYSVIDSVVKSRFVKLMDGGETNPVDFGEFIWSRSSGNILDFIETLDSEDYVKIKYENLVTELKLTGKLLCDFLGVSFDPAILTPYSGRRMRDGLGDPNFLNHDSIDSSLATVWKQIILPRPISRSSRMLATMLEYELP